MKYLVLFLLLISFNSFAQNCRYSASTTNFIGNITTSEQSVRHSLTIRKGSNSSFCRSFRAYFSTGNAGSYNRQAFNGTDSISYNIYKESALSTVLRDRNDANNGEYIEGNLQDRNVDYNFDFFIRLINLDTVFSLPPGVYTDLVQINIYNQSIFGIQVFQTTVNLNIQIVVPQFIELSLGPLNMQHDPSSTQYLMDFGILSSGSELQATLNVKGNVGHGIFMSSDNGSLLDNGFSSTVPYQVKIGSSTYLSLSGAGSSHLVEQSATGTPSSSSSYPVSVKLGTVTANQESGDYTDSITISVQVW